MNSDDKKSEIEKNFVIKPGSGNFCDKYVAKKSEGKNITQKNAAKSEKAEKKSQKKSDC